MSRASGSERARRSSLVTTSVSSARQAIALIALPSRLALGAAGRPALAALALLTWVPLEWGSTTSSAVPARLCG
jgi:hypothetical protein